MDTDASRRPAVDPRVERSRRVIRQAAMSELVEAGYVGFAIDSVAARAGVSRTTIYRHWDSKPALIADALETLNKQPEPDLVDGTHRDRVEQLLRHLAEVLASSALSRSVPALVDAAERDPTVRDLYHRYNARRRQALVDAIAAGIESGEFPAGVDPDLATLALAGAVTYRRLMTGTPLDPASVPRLVELVLGTRAYPSPRRGGPAVGL